MNIFERLLRIGQAEIHSAVNEMEDPIKMTEQGIRELRDDLDKSLEALAQIKAMAIKSKNDKNKKQAEAEDYTNKAVLLMTKAQKGELDIPQAERLAREALILKENLLTEAVTLGEQQAAHEQAVDEHQKNIDILKFNITKWENELKTLKARIKVSKATKEVNKQMARIDSNGTVGMLERMKEKIEGEEALSQAYDEITKSNASIREEINKAMNKDANKIDQSLDEIKRKLGML